MNINLSIKLSATYTSVWEGGEITSMCAIETGKAQVEDVQVVDDTEGYEILISECVDVFMGNEWYTFDAEGGDFTLKGKEEFQKAFNTMLQNAFENASK
ncbi:hypothetical protein LMH73_011645 [Vibrio splendidus]|nr:hypothetical protein [Vibrio splendidus]MCC4883051.1 hypothetical protein [Vibrio splendidus]